MPFGISILSWWLGNKRLRKNLWPSSFLPQGIQRQRPAAGRESQLFTLACLNWVWQIGRIQANIILPHFPWCPIASGLSSKNWFTTGCLSVNYLPPSAIPDSKPPSSSHKMAYKPQLSNVSSNLMSYGTPESNKFWAFSPVNLSHVNSITNPARRTW